MGAFLDSTLRVIPWMACSLCQGPPSLMPVGRLWLETCILGKSAQRLSEEKVCNTDTCRESPKAREGKSKADPSIHVSSILDFQEKTLSTKRDLRERQEPVIKAERFPQEPQGHWSKAEWLYTQNMEEEAEGHSWVHIPTINSQPPGSLGFPPPTHPRTRKQTAVRLWKGSHGDAFPVV